MRSKGMVWVGLLAIAMGWTVMAGPAAAEPGVTKDLIKVGATMDLSGPIAFMGKGVRDGAQLYFKYINDQGGIFGRKIEFLVEDDGYSSPRAVQAVKKLTTSDGVFCMFLVLGSTQSEAMYPLLESQKIPLVAPATQNRSVAVPPKKYLFLADPNYTLQSKLGVEFIVEDLGVKKPKLGCIYQDDSPGHDWRHGVQIAAKHFGLEVLELPYKRGAVDFSSQVAKCKEAGVTHVLMWTLVREPAMILKEAKRLQYHATYITSTASGAKQVLTLAEDAADYAKGVWATGMVNDVFSTKNAAIDLYKQNLAKYKIGNLEDFYCLYGYQAAITFTEALKRTGANLTREGLVAALETFKNYDNGILAPITWGKDQRAGGKAIKMYQAVQGMWKESGTWRFSKIKEE